MYDLAYVIFFDDFHIFTNYNNIYLIIKYSSKKSRMLARFHLFGLSPHFFRKSVWTYDKIKYVNKFELLFLSRLLFEL